MIQVVSENEYFIVLFKPHGVSTHNQSPNLLEYLKQHKKPEHFLNRLDGETSGLVVVAQNEKLHEPLRKSLDEGTKKYRALLRGSLPDSTTWLWPLSDKAEGRRNPQGEKGNWKEAKTEVKIVRQNKFFSEVEIILKTGRQHQIRKHSALAKHAIVGDSRYNDEKYNLKIAEIYKDDRLQLEAETLQFIFKNEIYFFEKRTLILDKFFSTSSLNQAT